MVKNIVFVVFNYANELYLQLLIWGQYILMVFLFAINVHVLLFLHLSIANCEMLIE